MIWAVALVAIMGLVALAIDLGNIAQTKQHAANAAQDAVLSAVGDLVSLAPGGTGTISVTGCPNRGGFTSVQQETVACAEDYLHNNYSTTDQPLPSSTDNSAPRTYDSCGSVFPLSLQFPGADCFAFFNPSDPTKDASAPNAMGVAVPARTVKYTFGRVAGVITQKVSSVAYASIQTADNGYILPFGFPSPPAGNGYNCLKDTTGNTGCSSGAIDSGQFGVIDNPRYLIFPQQDKSNGGNTTLMENANLGLDHPLITNASGTLVCDWIPPSNSLGINGSGLSGCGNSYDDISPFDNGDYVNTGNGQTVNDLTGPLFTGFNGDCSGFAPRFARADGFLASSTCGVDQATSPQPIHLNSASGDLFGGLASNLNGVPVAHYVTSSFQEASIYSACNADVQVLSSKDSTPLDLTTSGQIDFSTDANMVWNPYNTCFSNLMGSHVADINALVSSSTYVFNSDIEKSPRFGIVPILDYNVPGSATPIIGFDAVYLDIGVPKSKHSSKVGAIQAWVFPLSWIQPSSTSGGGIGQELGGNYVTNLCAYKVNC